MPDTSTITSMEQWLDLVESQLSELSEGQIIEGVITHITPNEILVDIGAKQEGIVPLSDIEWVDESIKANIKEGATVRAYVMRTFEDDEPPLLSISRAAQEKDWQWLENLSDDELVEGRVAEVNKGGLIVYVGMVRGFVPASHVVSVNTKVPDRQAVLRQLLGKTLTLKVLEADSKDNRLILSEREAKKEELQRRKRQMLESLKVGDVLRGRITNVVDFGAFVDLDGVDGMIHISELSWDRIEHPSEVVKVGDELDVYVLKIDHKRERIGLSLKRLHPE
ncbi:MAG: S1 RNA-binding domain-containing protein, partial [Ardenticatenia bacterium]